MKSNQLYKNNCKAEAGKGLSDEKPRSDVLDDAISGMAKELVAEKVASDNVSGEETPRDQYRMFVDFHGLMPMPVTPLDSRSGIPGDFAVGAPMRHLQDVGTNLEQESRPSPITQSARSMDRRTTPGAEPPEISAHLVNDNDDRDHEENPTTSTSPTFIEVFDGHVTGKKDTPLYPTNNWFGLLIGFTICLVLAVVLPLALFKKSSNNNGLRPATHKGNSTESNQHSPDHPFQDDLPLAVLNLIQDDLGGPFWKANRWLLDDPNFHGYSQERQRQRFYLALVFYATNGDTTWIQHDHWLSYNVSECQWFSSSTFVMGSKYYLDHVCDENNTFINLSLANNNLTGSLPIYYTDFIPTLKVFDIGGNYIGGTLPVMSTTPYIEIFVLAQNLFGGAYRLNADPFFDSLRVVKVDYTKVNGNAGGAVNYILPKAEVLNLTGNPSDGEVWTSLGMLTNLEYLGYSHRGEVHGIIPTELGKMTALKEIHLANLTMLEGTIPSEMGLLTELTKLDLWNTPVTGAVPFELCYHVAAGKLEILAECDGGALICCNSS